MQLQNYHNGIKRFSFVVLSVLIVGNTAFAQEATTSDTLKAKIEERNNQIKQLEQEINQYNGEILNTQGQARTLQNTIKTLDLTRKKISTDINLTQAKITKASLSIDDIDERISDNKAAITAAIRNTSFQEDQGLVMTILSKKNIGEVWGDIDNIKQVRDLIRVRTGELSILEDNLKIQKKELQGLKQDLTGKKLVVEVNKKEKSDLLTETKNKEQTFKDLVKTKEQLKAQFEAEVYDYESQLNYLIDPKSFPGPQHGILSWPLDTVFVTQKFGKTVGAERLYTSGTHNGVDFRATVGTPVKNVLDGTVSGTGNTDAYPGCYSFGKWVLVRHDNGLSTIYGHLSVISVSQGQRLSTGEIVGYSGNTGYSTGPHLHITVYATQGVRVEKYVNSRGCKEAIIPLADLRAYLDPLAYFPSL